MSWCQRMYWTGCRTDLCSGPIKRYSRARRRSGPAGLLDYGGGNAMPSRTTLACIAPIVLALLGIATAAEAQYPKREIIQVGLIDRTFFPQPVFVAIQNGYFADEGLDANIRFIRSGEGQAEGLMKG